MHQAPAELAIGITTNVVCVVHGADLVDVCSAGPVVEQTRDNSNVQPPMVVLSCQGRMQASESTLYCTHSPLRSLTHTHGCTMFAEETN